MPRDSLVVEVAGTSRAFSRDELTALARDTVTTNLHNGSPQLFMCVRVRALVEKAGFDAARMRGPAPSQYLIVEARDIIAFTADGKPIPAEGGPWRLIVPGDGHGARRVRQVTTIRVRTAPR